jgi:hypothetical protein
LGCPNWSSGARQRWSSMVTERKEEEVKMRSVKNVMSVNISSSALYRKILVLL